MFLQKIAVSETIFRNGSFYGKFSNNERLNWVALSIIFESSVHPRISGKNFHRYASFGAVDFDIGKLAIFVLFRRFFFVGTKLPFLHESSRIRDINCRLGDKMPV